MAVSGLGDESYWLGGRVGAEASGHFVAGDVRQPKIAEYEIEVLLVRGGEPVATGVHDCHIVASAFQQGLVGSGQVDAARAWEAVRRRAGREEGELASLHALSPHLQLGGRTLPVGIHPVKLDKFGDVLDAMDDVSESSANPAILCIDRTPVPLDEVFFCMNWHVNAKCSLRKRKGARRRGWCQRLTTALCLPRRRFHITFEMHRRSEFICAAPCHGSRCGRMLNGRGDNKCKTSAVAAENPR